MPNSDLKGKIYNVPEPVVSKVTAALSKYQNGGDTKGYKKAKRIANTKEMSYEQMKMMLTFFNKYEDKDPDSEYYLNGGETMKDWVSKTLGDSRDAIHHTKKIQMDTGRENVFKKTHEKDKANADPTRIRMPKIHKGSKMRNIMNNDTVYESLDEEINHIKYLIEYFDNNKQK
jgi:hypothetical protein